VDRAEIASLLRRDGALHLYELGDLDDFFWPSTTYWTLDSGGGGPRAGGGPPGDPVALLYTGTTLPVLVALGRPAEAAAVRSLLRVLRPTLPARFYAHLLPGTVDALDGWGVEQDFGVHHRMVLADRGRLSRVDTSSATPLDPSHEGELLAFYHEAYPDNWFDARMLETGAYLGVRDADGRLTSVAGVHVVSREQRVAALGNVATTARARGQGLGRVATAAVCKALAPATDLVGLNVARENAPAIALYRSLGFEHVELFDELLLRRHA